MANGTGTIASANVANIVVTCADQAYAVGGTVVGLNGSGLVLANGSDTVTVTAGATTFTLPTPVAFSSSYTVTVQTQPAGLSCSVAGGSGTMPAATVSAVVVTCTDQPFTVGGTISGLGSNTGLVLTNGSDTLPVPASSTTFTLPTPVNFGSTYSVMAQSPTGLTCTVTGGSGTMAAANVTNVTVVCSDLSYSLGGTISGLSASGLILSNGTDTLTVTSGASTFTMPSPVAFGGTYTVLASSQPTGEMCTVSNGTNTMPASAVTNVAVTCSLLAYTVGGSISGLTASGLVLLDNGVDATTISANATSFSMNTAVASQSPYSVSVQSHPVAVNCAVTTGSGTVVASAVATVAVGCAAGSESVLHSFAGGTSDGSQPQSGLLLASNGKFYGVTQFGGANTYGVLYQFDPATQTYTALYSFYANTNDGAQPFAALIQGSDGKLYGTTQHGGTSTLGGVGTIFSYDLGTNTETVLYSFGAVANDGGVPSSGVIQGADGNLYGVTDFGGTGGGVLYEYNLTSQTYSIIYTFGTNGGTADAYEPSGLIQASDGNFYGTSVAGGTAGSGALYEFNPNTVTETVLHSFANTSSDGGSPQGSLTRVSGVLYGMTSSGGTNSGGTIFSYNVTTPAYLVQYSFGAGADGSAPQGTLLKASDGNLYGLTTAGGTNGTGAIFMFNPITPAESVLYSFATGASDGAFGLGALIETTDGNLYGVTNAGGSASDGSIFVLN